MCFTEFTEPSWPSEHALQSLSSVSPPTCRHMCKSLVRTHRHRAQLIQ